MTLDQIADNILSLEGKYDITHPDYAMRRETMIDLVKNKTSLFIRRDLDRNNRADFYSRRIEVEVIPVTIGGNLNCLRTKNKIPEPVLLKGDSDFFYVGSMDAMQPFSMIKFSDIADMSGCEITGGRGRYSRKNDYLYILNTTNEAEMIAVDAAWVEIIDGSLNVDDVRLFDVTYEFPASRDMIDRVTTAITEDLRKSINI